MAVQERIARVFTVNVRSLRTRLDGYTSPNTRAASKGWGTLASSRHSGTAADARSPPLSRRLSNSTARRCGPLGVLSWDLAAVQGEF